MNIKWAVIGGVAVAATALMVLPGVVSAHHPEIEGESSCNNDGSWNVDFTVSNSENSPSSVTSFDNNNSSDFIGGFFNNDDGPFSGGRDMRVEDIDASEGTVEGVSDGDVIQNNGSANGVISEIGNDVGSTELEVEAYWRYYNNQAAAAAGDFHGAAANALDNDVTASRSETFNAPDFASCKTSVCTDGQNGVETFIDFSNPTGDCDPVRLCVDGESMTVTEFDAKSLDGEKGSCTPGDTPPPPPPTTTDEEPEPQPEEVAVANVSPAVDEVAALPAAGYGSTDATSYTWAAVLGLALVGLGASTALIARARR